MRPCFVWCTFLLFQLLVKGRRARRDVGFMPVQVSSRCDHASLPPTATCFLTGKVQCSESQPNNRHKKLQTLPYLAHPAYAFHQIFDLFVH
ncbi:hypothetical protein BJV82DRAFT_594901 [Fennellomyces sp. T-0311]|nr:hypothetical protein BJV82DRAFT_594901 [Fennellomyces sp. T-0311]